MANKALGRGLSFLLQDEKVPIKTEATVAESKLDINLIYANTDQPRKKFDDDRLKELADSIVNHGLLQPIIVNKEEAGRYRIIAGERRFRAAKIAGLGQVPVIIKHLKEKEILEIALIENIQRQDLSCIEEAEALQKLIADHGYGTNDLAEAIGKSRSHVANLLRLNNLTDAIKTLVANGSLSMGHARCLIGVEDSESLAQKIIDNDLNVRQTEELVNNRKKAKMPAKEDSNPGRLDNSAINEDLVLLGQSLSERFGVKVVVKNSWNGGSITFHYSNLEELDSILTRFN